MNIPPGEMNEKKIPAAMLRCLTMRIGTVAFSPFLNWIMVNMIKKKADRTNRTIMRVLDHE